MENIKKSMVVGIINNETGELEPCGMSFPMDILKTEDFLESLLVELNAATLEETNTVVVTALFVNSFAITEVYTFKDGEDKDIHMAVQVCMEAVERKLADHLDFVHCCATMNPDRAEELTKRAQEYREKRRQHQAEEQALN